MVKLTFLASCLAIVACAHAPLWKHPTKTVSQFSQDKTKCRVQTSQYYQTFTNHQNIITGKTDADDFFADCMNGEGWSKVN